MKRSVLALLFSFACFGQQADVWHHIAPQLGAGQLKNVTPARNQLAVIRDALKDREQMDVPLCMGQEPAWMEKVSFSQISLSETENALLVEAGVGCARSAQGANGAMWLIRFQGEKLLFLATPEHQFNGWLYSIQPAINHGYRDLVLGWHMSSRESKLSYFSFDGKSYSQIGTAQLQFGEGGQAKIIPNPAFK